MVLLIRKPRRFAVSDLGRSSRRKCGRVRNATRGLCRDAWRCGWAPDHNHRAHRDEIAAGWLIQPFSLLASAGRGYYLVYPESRRNVPKIRMFRDWMLEATAYMREGAES